MSSWAVWLLDKKYIVEIHKLDKTRIYYFYLLSCGDIAATALVGDRPKPDDYFQ